MINIWNYLLAVAILAIQRTILALFPDATSMINFASPMVQGFVVFCELAYTFFSVFNLWLFGFYIAFYLVMSLVKIIMTVVKFIKEVLPLILAFFA